MTPPAADSLIALWPVVSTPGQLTMIVGKVRGKVASGMMVDLEGSWDSFTLKEPRMYREDISDFSHLKSGKLYRLSSVRYKFNIKSGWMLYTETKLPLVNRLTDPEVIGYVGAGSILIYLESVVNAKDSGTGAFQCQAGYIYHKVVAGDQVGWIRNTLDSQGAQVKFKKLTARWWKREELSKKSDEG